MRIKYHISFLNQHVVAPGAKTKLPLLTQSAMSVPHPLTPSSCILHIAYFQRPKTIPLPLLVLAPVIIAVRPTELPIAII